MRAGDSLQSRMDPTVMKVANYQKWHAIIAAVTFTSTMHLARPSPLAPLMLQCRRGPSPPPLTLPSSHQDVEFTVQGGRLFMLQCRGGKRTGQAALQIAVDMHRWGLCENCVEVG